MKEDRPWYTLYRNGIPRGVNGLDLDIANEIDVPLSARDYVHRMYGIRPGIIHLFMDDVGDTLFRRVPPTKRENTKQQEPQGG